MKHYTRLVPDIFIIPLWKRGANFPPFFHHTIHYRADQDKSEGKPRTSFSMRRPLRRTGLSFLMAMWSAL